MTAEGDENYLTTAQVARRLRIKPETVYAYVSRGLLTSVRARGRRGSLFPAADIEALAARTVDHTGAVEQTESALTLIADDELSYRGHNVRELATTSSVESVAHLLWTGELAPQSPFPVGPVDLARAAIAVLPPTARRTDQLRIAVAALSAADPLRFDLSPTTITTTARTLLGTLVAALPGPDTPGAQTPGEHLWPKLAIASSDTPRPDLIDAALILLADHGLAVSTVAARVAASARANLYAVVSAGLGALDGQYHGAAPTLAYEFLARAKSDPLAALSEHLRTGAPIPGFGHKIYKHRDPRAEVLLDLLGSDPIVDVVQTLTDHVSALPNSDLALAALAHAHSFPPDAGEALFALARITGWTAHALEEYAAPALRFRSPGIYTGETLT